MVPCQITLPHTRTHTQLFLSWSLAKSYTHTHTPPLTHIPPPERPGNTQPNPPTNIVQHEVFKHEVQIETES